jgi:two-component system response regulator
MINDEVEILLIEDNPNDAELTIRVLKKNNLSNKIVHIKDGVEALNFIFCEGIYKERNILNKPKLILLDLKMPKISGIEILEKLKSENSTRQIPIVVLTSSKEDPDVRTCYKLGVNSYIVKPVDFESFQHVVANLGFYWMLVNHT